MQFVEDAGQACDGTQAQLASKALDVHAYVKECSSLRKTILQEILEDPCVIHIARTNLTTLDDLSACSSKDESHPHYKQFCKKDLHEEATCT